MLTSVVEGFTRAAARFGDKVALQTASGPVSYEALRDGATRLASALRNRGVQPGDRVTLYAANGADWVVSYYGVQLAGAVANPVNAMLTPEEVGFVVRDCGSRVVIGSRDKLLPLLPLRSDGAVPSLICFGADTPDGMLSFDALVQASAAGSDAVQARPDDTSTICYTSGTTGHPKGAMQSHRSVLMNAELTALMHGRQASDIVVTALPLTHVYGTVVMNSTLLNGGTLVLHSKFDERAVLESIANHRATLFEGVPTMYFYLLNFPDLDHYDLSSLRLCTVGGQTMPVAKMEAVERRFGCPLIELWGMTELAGLATTFLHNGPVKHGSIGVPLPYCRAKIVHIDDCSKELPADEAGELMISGPLVMQGYCGNPQATKETIESDGWLHTGDIAQIDADGFVYIVDRKKDMILTAGFNVYPAELERVIAAHPHVAMVAVGPIADEAKGELPKAYIVPKTGSTPVAEEIIEHCRGHLAPYKIPRAVQFVEDLPKTSTGKIVRRRLKELDRRAQ